jgi:hypothetical protein
MKKNSTEYQQTDLKITTYIIRINVHLECKDGSTFKN